MHAAYYVRFITAHPRGGSYVAIVGKMVMELGDSCYVKCPKNGFVCHLDFKTKVSATVQKAADG